MKKCPYCGERIPEEATRCPTCGHDFRTQTTSQKIKELSPASKLILILAGLLAVLVVITLASYSNSTPAAHPPEATLSIKTQSRELPTHVVAKNAAIMTGRRIEIHVDDPSITKEQCLALLAEYHDQALPDGQVSVRKPDKTGAMTPWCVDNFAKGILFNDDLFR